MRADDTRPVPFTSLLLEIDPDSVPVCGRLSGEHGSHVFEGWLGLARALEAQLGREDRDDAAPDRSVNRQGKP